MAVCVSGSSVNESASLICAEFPGSMSRDLRRTAQKWISFSFLGLVDTPQKVAKVIRRSISRRSPKGPPKGPKTSATLLAGEIYFRSVLPCG